MTRAPVLHRARPPSSARPQVLDVALALATALVVIVAVVADLGRDGPAPPAAYVFAVGFGALMLVRRPYPVLALVATSVGLLGYYALGYPPIGLAVPVAAALFSAAEAGALVWAVVAAALLVGASSVARTVSGEDPRYLFAFELPTTLAVMAAAVALGDSARSRRLWRAELLDRVVRERAQAEADASRRVQEDRLALARDVHDVVAHSLSVVNVHADVAAEALQDGDPLSAAAAVERIREAGRGAGRELRLSVRALREPGQEAQGAGSADPPARLERLVAAAREAGMPVRLQVHATDEAVSQEVNAVAYRVVQESLSNVRRHAPDTQQVDVAVTVSPTAMHVSVTNAGAPPRAARRDARDGGPDSGPGLGLCGIRERVHAVGGRVDAGHRGDGGFCVDAVLPLRTVTG